MRSGGYDNLNFADIAGELNTTRANLHHHFKNKEGLATAATKAYMSEYKENLDELIRNNDGEIVAILTGIENHLVNMFANDSTSSGCIVSQLLNDREAPSGVRQIALDLLQKEVKILSAQLEKAKTNGILNGSAEIEKLSYRIMSMMLGIPQMALLEQDFTKTRKSINGALVSLIE